MVYVSGMIAMDPIEKKMVGGSDVAAQTRQCLENMKHVLEAGGSSLAQVVKCLVLMTDMADYPKINAVYAECKCVLSMYV